MAIRTADGGVPSTPFKRALSLYREGLYDLREAAAEAGLDEWEFQEHAKSAVPPTAQGLDDTELPVFIRPRN